MNCNPHSHKPMAIGSRIPIAVGNSINAFIQTGEIGVSHYVIE